MQRLNYCRGLHLIKIKRADQEEKMHHIGSMLIPLMDRSLFDRFPCTEKKKAREILHSEHRKCYAIYVGIINNLSNERET